MRSGLIGLLVVAATGWTSTLLMRSLVIDSQYARRLESRPSEDVLRSPGRPALLVVAVEHPFALADLMWLGIVQELGQADRAKAAAWDRVERWTDIATDFDPRYFTVYHSAGVNLSVWAKRVEASDRILLRAWTALPERWELPMLLGYNAYFVRGDARLASDYMHEASRISGAPRFLAPLAGRMRFHAGDITGAMMLLEALLQTIPEGPARDDVEQRLAILKSESILTKYDEACQAYRAQFGSIPTAQTLFQTGVVKEPPQDLLGSEITFDDKCIARTQVIRTREFEAQKRIGQDARQNP